MKDIIPTDFFYNKETVLIHLDDDSFIEGVIEERVDKDTYKLTNGLLVPEHMIYSIESDGVIFNNCRDLGVNYIMSRKLEIIFWSTFEEFNNPNWYEKNHKDFLRGKSNKKYNEI